jgi:hypothetical protein
MNFTPNNCGPGPQPNPALAGLRNSFAGRIFSYFDFDKVIRDTLNNDMVITNVKKTSPYFGGSVFSFNNVVSNNLYYQYLNAYLTTKVMYKRMETIRHQYLVEAALQCLVDDSMAMDPSTGEVFEIRFNPQHPKSERAQLLINDFEKHFKLDRFINTIIEDAIFWGEYSCTLQGNKTDDKGEFNGTKQAGITHIIDANPPGTIFGVWDGAAPQFFVRLKKGINTAIQGQLERLEPTSVWNIGIFPQKIRFSLGYGQWLLDDSNRIAQFFRIGKPLFYSVYNKILELEAFEQAQYQKEFADLKRRGLVGISAPSGLSLDQLGDFAKFYERILNESQGPDNLLEIQGLDVIAHMMSSLSQVRAVPIQPDRGRIDPIDIKTAADGLIEKINDRRKIILEAIGIPFEYVFGARDGGKVNLRQYIRYARRCKVIQDGIGWSLQRLLRTHLMDNGILCSLDDISVHFFNTVNVAEMDRLEHLDAVVMYLRNFDEMLRGLAQSPVEAMYIDVSEKMRYYRKVFSQIEGLGNVIKVPDGDHIMADKANEIMFQQQLQQQIMSQQAMPQPQPGGVPGEEGGEGEGGEGQPQATQPPSGTLSALPPNVTLSTNGMPGNVTVSTGGLPPNVNIVPMNETEKDELFDKYANVNDAFRANAQVIHERRTARSENLKSAWVEKRVSAFGNSRKVKK